MMSVEEIAGFIERLPEEACVVTVAQVGSKVTLLRTGNLYPGPGTVNWTQATWDGLDPAYKERADLMGLPDDDAPLDS